MSTPPAKQQPLIIAYFVPSDREPIDGYVDRLDALLMEVQSFYRRGMDENGFGPKTFGIPRNEAGELDVHVVAAPKPSVVYGRNAGGLVRQTVYASLAQQGIAPGGRTLVIFQVLLQWKDGKATEIGPYIGGGNHLAGTAWVYDDALLDPAKLSSKEPGGYYHGKCSIGKFNTHYIGGIAHEMGHAFGLPHCKQRIVHASRGIALMGSGNHTYGRELRGEGSGTFLTKTSAMRLAYCRPFAGDIPGATGKHTCKMEELAATFADGTIKLTGRLNASPHVFGIAGYNDNDKPRGDYDALALDCEVADGRFELDIDELRPGQWELRLFACHESGGVSRFVYRYEVDENGKPKLDAFRP